MGMTSKANPTTTPVFGLGGALFRHWLIPLAWPRKRWRVLDKARPGGAISLGARGISRTTTCYLPNPSQWRTKFKSASDEIGLQPAPVLVLRLGTGHPAGQ